MLAGFGPRGRPYLDPTGHLGRAVAAGVAAHPAGRSHVAAWIAPTTAGAVPVAPAVHPVLERANRVAEELLGGSFTLTDLAARVGLSASRLGHLFADQLGMTFPAWRRWTRLLHALRQVEAGASFTVAAHAAGFADSAHLTRACRGMVGLTPTEVRQAIGQAGRGSGSDQAGSAGRR